MIRRGFIAVFAAVLFMAGSVNVKAEQDLNVVDVQTETVVEVTPTEALVSGGDIVGNVLYAVAPEPDVQEVQMCVDAEGNLTITADYTLDADMSITGNLVVSSGKLDLNGHTLIVGGTVDINGGSVDVNGGKLDVTGDFHIGTMGKMDGSHRVATSTGSMVMDGESDEVFIGGDFEICSTAASTWSDGMLYIGGDFAQYGTRIVVRDDANPSCFNAEDSHTVRFSEGSAHKIYFDSTKSGFNKVDFANGEINFASTIRGFSLYEDVEWNLKPTATSIGFAGTLNLAGHRLIVNNDMNLTSGVIDINGGALEIKGDLSIGIKGEMDGSHRVATSTGSMVMAEANDEVVVYGDFTICSTIASTLSDGTMYIDGNFEQYGTKVVVSGDATPSCFNAEDSHQVVFSKDKSHSIYFDSTKSGFNKVDFGNGAIKFASNIRGLTLYEDVEWNLKSTVTSIGFDGTLDLAGHTLTVNNDMNLTSGIIDINEGCLEVKGNFSIGTKGEMQGSHRVATSSGSMVMDEVSDKVIVNGDFVICSTVASTLSEGTMYIDGDFAQYGTRIVVTGDATPECFNAEDSHLVVFSKDKPHSIYFDSTQSGFSKVDFGNGEIEFASSIRGLTLYEDVEWNLKSTATSIGFGNTMNLAGYKLTINGDFNLTSGTIDINEGCLEVKGSLSIGTIGKKSGSHRTATSTGMIVMAEETDEVVVNGDFTICSTATSTWSAGTMYIGGDFAQYGPKVVVSGDATPNSFVADEDHKVVLCGKDKQNVLFEGSASHFGTLVCMKPLSNYTFNPSECWISYVDGTAILVKEFVERMYTVALGREADQAGVTFWADQLINKTNDGASLSANFILGQEFAGKNYNDEQYIQVLYSTFFSREADSEGKAYWMSVLANGSRESVLAGFVNSNEFFTLCRDYGISRGVLRADGTAVNCGIYQFAERLYSKVLERDGDKDGIEYWTTLLDSRACTPENAAMNFFFSDEYVAMNTSDEDYIKALYRTFMGREADESGLDSWKNAMKEGLSRQGALASFAASDEFKNIMASYGL